MTKKMWLSLFCAILGVGLLAGCDDKNKEAQQDMKNDSQDQVVKAEEKEAAEEKPQGPPRVKLETSMGDIVIELNEEKAPITTKNFLRYVNEGYYDGTIFHRVIRNFMIQGGGFDTNLVEKTTYGPIKNEANNGLSNDRGTISMARTSYPDSATSQFFINHVDNARLNYAPSSAGYAVFGKVVEGMEVVDAIANVKTTAKLAATRGGEQSFQDVPVETVVINSAKVVSE